MEGVEKLVKKLKEKGFREVESVPVKEDDWYTMVEDGKRGRPVVEWAVQGAVLVRVGGVVLSGFMYPDELYGLVHEAFKDEVKSYIVELSTRGHGYHGAAKFIDELRKKGAKILESDSGFNKSSEGVGGYYYYWWKLLIPADVEVQSGGFVANPVADSIFGGSSLVRVSLDKHIV